MPLGVWVVYRVMSGCLEAMASSDTMEKFKIVDRGLQSATFRRWVYTEKIELRFPGFGAYILDHHEGQFERITTLISNHQQEQSEDRK